MIIQLPYSWTLPQFNPIKHHLTRGFRWVETGAEAIVKRTRQNARPKELAIRRGRRNSFLKRINYAWKTTDPDHDGSFTALAAVLDPWIDWTGEDIHPTPYQAFQLYWLDWYDWWLYGFYDPVDRYMAPAPWPPTWKPRLSWFGLELDWNSSPPTVTLYHPEDIGIYSHPQLTVYLGAPRSRITTNYLDANLFAWTNHCGIAKHNPFYDVWYLPDWQAIYPWTLPHGTTSCAVRPDNGWDYDPDISAMVKRPCSDRIFGFLHPNPAG